MSYLAAGDEDDDGFFSAPENFDRQISVIQQMGDEILKSQIPAEISIQNANDLLEANYNLALELDRQCTRMTEKLTNFAVISSIRMACAASQNYHIRYVMPLQIRVTAAKRAGQTTVSSADFNRNLANHLFGIVGTYQTLQYLEDVKPWLLRNMSPVLALIAKIGEIWQRVMGFASAGMKAVTNAASALGGSIGTLITLFKWGSIAAGLAALYYYVLKPKKS